MLPARPSRIPERQTAHAANQSTPLMPAQPEDAEQPARDRCRLRNYCAPYPDIVDDVLEIVTI